VYERNPAERILVVEDDAGNCAALINRLRVEFPEARIDAASNLGEALEIARTASDHGEFYHVACLDVCLPRYPKDKERTIHPEERKALLRALRERATIINYTSRYTADVRDMIVDLEEPNFPKTVLVDASLGKEWTKELMHFVRQAIYGRRINKQLDTILEASQGLPVGGAAARGGGTQALGSLIRDIKEGWRDFDLELQRRIRTVFSVEEVGDELIVNL